MIARQTREVEAAELFALEFLGRLEMSEATLLSWGVVEGSFTEDEVLERAHEYVEAAWKYNSPPIGDAQALLDELQRLRVLWRITGTNSYRTRMAEAVRLFASLRQIFPDRHDQPRWRTASNLVADYRLLLRPRGYPRRHLAPEVVLDRVSREVTISARQRVVAECLLRAGEKDERHLSDFQVDSTIRVLREHSVSRSTGTVVSAGTGSGKTLAFYLPTFMALAEQIDTGFWTKCLAIYPRNELLKDQFMEAFEQARRIDDMLVRSSGRKLVIAPLYGDIPQTADEFLQPGSGSGHRTEAWKIRHTGSVDGRICPFLRCPRCRNELLWLIDDIKLGRERLCCIDANCGTVVQPDEIRLTRHRMYEQPPDILFTSTEMLNRSMASGHASRLYGVGVANARTPRFILLDEMHTYEGTHGAQIALLLRRWRRLSGATPHFVGLSATLADARRFFAELVDVYPSAIEEVTPTEQQMEYEGMEYLLALRGDPVSGTSLLSTTIQAVMLLRRILDPTGTDRLAYGQKVFAFTDNLDIINRLYHDLLDAEGWTDRRFPNRHKAFGSLANLRSPTLPNHTERLGQGQSWDVVDWIGNTLVADSRVHIDRTSSQDQGVNRRADIIVATASLEVGFDDPDVGAVLQHKAPLSAAQFLQRKGRAGRKRGMRPWTTVILSDYGRDRIAYQGYDLLFSPELSPRFLPVGNRYVLRIQAVFALFDWLAMKMNFADKFQPWRDLSQPDRSGGDLPSGVRHRALKVIEAVLGDGAARSELERYLESALAIDADEVQAILWEPPRSLVTTVLPTLRRRLDRNWRRATPSDDPERLEEHRQWSPLPEFVPTTLYNDLNTPDVELELRQDRNLETRHEWMPIQQALHEFAPGRVSRRFGIEESRIRHWVAPPSGDFIDVQSFCAPESWQDLGEYRYRADNGVVDSLPVIRPHRIVADQPPQDVGSSSNSFQRWHTQIVEYYGTGLYVDLPQGTGWDKLVSSIRFHTHNLGDPIDVRRFSIGADVTVVREGHDTRETFIRYVHLAPNDEEPRPTGIGFLLDVDGFAVRVHVPEDLRQRAFENAELARGLRPAFFEHLVRNDPYLDGVANRFARGWLSQIFLSALTTEAIGRGSLEAALRTLQAGEAGIPFERVLETIFQSLPESMGGAENEAPDNETRGRRHRELSELLAREDVRNVMYDAARVLWEPPDERWDEWLRERFKATLGAAILDAAQSLCPDLDVGDLTFDLDAGPGEPGTQEHSDQHDLWFVESTIGGAGFIESLLRRYGEDPRRFFELVDAALAPSDFENIDTDLRHILRWATTPADGMEDTLASVRKAMQQSHREAVQATHALRQTLMERGLVVTHSLLAALNARVLSPGSSAETDRLLNRLLQDWIDTEEQLGIDIAARVFAYSQSDSVDLDQALRHIDDLPERDARPQWRFGTLYGLLWPRGAVVREESLRGNNRFHELPPTDRRIVAPALDARYPRIDLRRDTWREELKTALVRHGVAALVARSDSAAVLAAALHRLVGDSIDLGYLLAYPRVRAIRREGRYIEAVLDIEAGLQ